MNKFAVFVIGAVAAAMLAGCSTPQNFDMPDGFTVGSRETPEVNLFFQVHPSRYLTAEMASEMHDFVEHYFRRSKRVTIWWQKSDRLDADVHTNAYFKVLDEVNAVESVMCAQVTLVSKFNERSGMAGESLALDGYSRRTRARNRLAAPMTFSVDKHFKDALNDALRKLSVAIERKFPVSAQVKDFRCYRGKAEFMIPVGTNFGLTGGHEYLVWHLRQDGGYTVVALAKCVPGAESSTVKVTAWNMDDPDVRDDLYNRLQNNDKSMLGSLFVTARLPRKK